MIPTREISATAAILRSDWLSTTFRISGNGAEGDAPYLYLMSVFVCVSGNLSYDFQSVIADYLANKKDKSVPAENPAGTL